MDEKDSATIKQLELRIKQLEKEVLNCEELIEENKLLEEKHNISQHKFKTVFEKSELGNKIINEDLAILEVNAALINLLVIPMQRIL